MTSQVHVLRLYRQLLKSSKKLKYTNKNFYVRQIQAEFRKHQNETNEETCKKQYEASFFYRFVQTKRLVMNRTSYENNKEGF